MIMKFLLFNFFYIQIISSNFLIALLQNTNVSEMKLIKSNFFLYVSTTNSHSSNTYLIFLLIAPLFNAFSPTVQTFHDTMRIKCFRLRLKPFLHRCLPWPMFISDAVSSILILRLPQARRSAAQNLSVLPFVHFPLSHKVGAILNCRCTVNFTSFHTQLPHKSDHRLLFFLVLSNAAATLLNMSRYYYHDSKHY